jgi:GMP synthase (glutamine-hydrolysing)
MVDNGLLRENEAEDVRKTLTEHFGVNLTVVDATDRFLADLKGVTDPEQKRKIIGKVDVAVFDVGVIFTRCRQRFYRGVQGESQAN